MEVFFEMGWFVRIVDFVGSLGFGISGIWVGCGKGFEWFGGYVVGLGSGIGGGRIGELLVDVSGGWMREGM